jgi:cytochrome c
MRLIAIFPLALVLAACATEPSSSDGRMNAGRQIAETHCSSCHAVGVMGESPRPEAPPFRTLSRSYRVSALEEALAEGISVGHPAMPAFQFQPDEIDALVSYLESIQEAP